MQDLSMAICKGLIRDERIYKVCLQYLQPRSKIFFFFLNNLPIYKIKGLLGHT